MSIVTQVPAAPSDTALRHFASALQFETDCWDVHHVLSAGSADFVLLDVRAPEAYATAHVPQARNLPHAKIISASLTNYPAGTLFVVYCAGPHCNGAQRAAIRLARLGRAVKVMIGGMSGWHAEGFAVATGTSASH